MKNKNLMKRIIAYFIDYTVVMLLVMLITNTKYLNPTYDEAIKKSNDLTSLSTSYMLSTNTLEYYYEDKVISEEEYNNLIKDNEYFGYLIVDAYSDKNITEEEYNSIIETAKEVYKEKSKDVYYEAIKANWFTYLVYTVVFFFYFVIFNMITKGVSLGKKITGLVITSTKKNKVSFGDFLGRSLISYGYFIYLFEIILPYVVPKDYLGTVCSCLSLGVNILQMAVMVSVLYNASGRGIHDYLCHTKVIDKNEEVLEAQEVEVKDVSLKDTVKEDIDDKKKLLKEEIEEDASKDEKEKKTKED